MQNVKLQTKSQNVLDLLKTQVEIEKCYSCEKCSSGCPVAKFMDYPPSKIVKWLSMGEVHRITGSNAIWICTSCQTCLSRCPFQIDIPHLIDILKEYVEEENLLKKEKKVSNFHELFLRNIKGFGRIYEAKLIFDLKLRNLKFFEDLPLGIKMFLKGKLKLLPSKVKTKLELKKLFGR